MKKKLLILLLALCMLFAFGFVIAGCEEGAQGPQGPAGPQGQAGANGEDGKDGSGWLSGEGAPNAQTGGNVGDFYLDEDSFGIYKLTEDGWEPVGSIMGAQGEQGEKGEQGATGPAGPAGPQGPAGATGANGEKGEQGEPGKDGVGVEDVAVEYGYNEDGREVIIFTFTFSDDTQKVVTVLIPRKVMYAYMNNWSDQCEVLSAGEEPPVWTMWVEYENGSEEVPVTEDMFVVDDTYGLIDLYTAGRYPYKIVYNGYVVSAGTVTVVDYDDRSPISMEVNAERVIALVDEEGALIENYDGLMISIYYADGSSETIVNASDPRLQIDTSAFSGAGNIFEVTVGFTEDEVSLSTSFEVVPLTKEQLADPDVMAFTVGEIMYLPWDGRYTCNIGEEPLFGNEGVIITGKYIPENKIAAYYFPLTSDMLVNAENEPFDNSVAGESKYFVASQYTYGAHVLQSVTIKVLDPNDTTPMSVYFNVSRVAVIVNDAGEITQPLVGVLMTVERANGESEPIDLSSEDERINIETVTLTAGETAEVQITFTEDNASLTGYLGVLPVTQQMLDEGAISFKSGHLLAVDGTSEFYFALGEDPFADGIYIELQGYQENSGEYVSYMFPAQSSMLRDVNTQEPFSNQAGVYEIDPTYTYGVSFWSQVIFYDPETLTVQYIWIDGEMNFPVGEGSFTGWLLAVEYSIPETGGSFTKNVPFEESMITSGSVDFDTPNIYILTITYQGAETEVTVTVTPDLEGAEVVGTYYFDPMTAMLLPESVTLYDNGTLIIDLGGDPAALPYTLEENTLTFELFGSGMLFSLEENAEDGKTYLKAYLPQEEPVTYLPSPDVIALEGMLLEKYEGEGYLAIYYYAEGSEPIHIFTADIVTNDEGKYLIMGYYYTLVDPADGEENGTITE